MDGLNLLLKLTNNILNKPKEEKFRTVKKTIKAIQAKIFSLKGGLIELLLAMGFVEVDAEHLVFVGEYFTILKRGVNLIEEALDPIKCKFMSPEEL
jgi:hypothetical protein